MAAEGENLDARMEAIRLKNEELEKKHKEIQEDEQNAKLMDAVVDTKSREVPKAHPYDNIELDFDVKDTDKELAKNPDYKPKNRRPMPRKELLDEIPPDPVNFLREEGDVDKQRQESSQNPRPPQNNNKNRNFNRNNRQEWPKQERSNNDVDRDSADMPSRPRNQNQRPRPQPQHQHQQQQQQQQNRSPQDGNAPRRQIPPQQLRSERRSAPTQSNEQQHHQQQQQQQTGHSQQHTPNRQRRPNNRPPNKEGVDRNNITVEITDEVRSVKLKQGERTFGTGRVGYSRPENVQKFTVDTFNLENSGENPQQNDRSPQDKPRNRNPRSNHNRRNQKPKEFTHPTLENIIVTKANVQDRLLKIANKDIEPKVVVAQPPVASEIQPESQIQPDNGN